MKSTPDVVHRVLEYAATALEGSGDNGDQYCAGQLRALVDGGTVHAAWVGEVTTEWGVRLPGGVIRWDPGYVPYTEIQARDDAARNDGILVRRTRTTYEDHETEWEPVDD